MDNHQYIHDNIDDLVNPSDKILIIYPHPDDEAFSCGGFIQRALKLGSNVKVVILTKGEASTLANGIENHDDLAEIRVEEFRQVMNLFGVTDYFVDSLPDKRLRDDTSEVRKAVANYISSYDPTIVITYEPSGVYGHPDHIFLSSLLTEFAQISTFKLIYSTVPKSFKPSEGALNMADDPSKVNPLKPNFIFNLSLGEYLIKLKAMGKYKSQFSLKNHTLHTFKTALMLKREYFHTV